MNLRRFRQILRQGPGRVPPQRLAGGDRLLLPFGGDAEKASVTDHLEYPRHPLHRRDIDLLQPGTRTGGTDDAAEHHAGQAQVLHKGGFPHDLGRDVESGHGCADDGVRRSGLGRRLCRGPALKRLALCDPAVAQPPAVSRIHLSACDLEGFRRYAEFDLAGEHGDTAGRIDLQPRSEYGGGGG